MADILVNGRVYSNIQLIAFDKDGTLLDFHRLWGQKAQTWVRLLAEHVGSEANNRQRLQQALYHTLGFNPTNNRVINDSPLAVASIPRLAHIAATVLYQHGVSWHDAEQIAQASLPTTINALPTANQVKSLGDVSSVFTQIAQTGIRIAVITSDDRLPTEATLPLLGIMHLVDVLICGNDDIPNKPAPDALWKVGQQFNIEPAHMLMVGDTASDMIFGRRASIAGCIGIRGGAGDQTVLSEQADEVINTIEEMLVRT